MSSGQQDDGSTYGFPVVRRGYDKAAVDGFARDAHAEITELRHAYETLAAHYAQLQAERDAAPTAPAASDYSGLGGRAQEILRLAEEQALDLTSRAAADADRLTEQTQHEVQTLRDHAVAELGEVRDAELARVDALRRQAEQEAVTLLASARAEAEQLLQAAHFEAGAVRDEAQGHARAAVEAAELRASTLLSDAERQALAVRQEAAGDRERVLAELTAESDDLRARIEQTLAESTAMHRRSAEHLAAEADEAARLRAEALAEVERIRQLAVAEADQLLATARQQAATVEERSRQEFAWRRRQLRQEQDLLTRRKQAMLSQLTSLSALAVETAESLPDVPELTLSEDQGTAGAGSADVVDQHADPADEAAAPPAGPEEDQATEDPALEDQSPEQQTAQTELVHVEPGEADEPAADEPTGDQPAAEGQNNRSSALSMPRSTS